MSYHIIAKCGDVCSISKPFETLIEAQEALNKEFGNGIGFSLKLCKIVEDIELLRAYEKQIPQKVAETYLSNGEVYGECPNCGRSGLKECTYHCNWCGQRIKWDIKIL